MTLLQEFHGSNTIMYDASGVVLVAWLLTHTVFVNAPCMCCDMLPFVRLVSRLQSGGCTNKHTRFFHQHQQNFTISRNFSKSRVDSAHLHLFAPLPDWFRLSESEQRLHAAEVGQLQRKLPFWVVRRVIGGVAFDNIYGPLPSLPPSSSPLESSSMACMWACECEEGDAVCYNVHDDDDWFRRVYCF